MNIFFLVCLACLVAVPITFTYFAGGALLGTLGWAVGTLRVGHRTHRQLLGPGGGSGLAIDPRPEVRRLLDETALARRGLGASYMLGTVHGQVVHMRTQTGPVNPMGQAVSLPLSRPQRKACEYVCATWMLIDVQAALPTNLHLHIQWMPEENILGNEDLAIALLNAEMQAVLRTGDQLLITEGRIGIDSPFGARDGRIQKMCEALAQAANRLAQAANDNGLDVAALLVDTATAEGPSRPRARAVTRLLQNHPRHPQAESIRQACLTDASADLRFAAARHSGAAGYAVVQEVVHDPDASEGLRQHALRFLIRNLPRPELLTLLEGLVFDAPELLRQIAIYHVAAMEHHGALQALLHAARSQDLQTLVDVAEALGRLRARAAEPVVRGLLHRGELAVQVAAADALGRIGALESVEALLQVGHRAGAPRELRIAALGSVHSIRARSSGASAGALSLTDPCEVGGLSLPEPLAPPPADPVDGVE